MENENDEYIGEEVRKLTINRIDKNDVIDFKTLCVRLECTLEEIMTVLIRYAISQGDQLYPALHELRMRRRADAKTKKIVNEKLKQLEPKICQ